MLAGISHDLRTPLARLRLETEMSVADEDAREHMAADIAQLDAIIDKFLDYARPDHVGLQAGAAARRDRRLHLRRAGPRGHQASTVDVPADLRVMADEVELQRVISNLVENARRYGKTPSTGVADITIQAQAHNDAVLIKVRDHGTGVAPAPAVAAEQALLPRRRGAHLGRRRGPGPVDRRPRTSSAWAAPSRSPARRAAGSRRTSACRAQLRSSPRPPPTRAGSQAAEPIAKPPAQRAASSSTTARASIARPSPTGPSFSAVLALTFT